MSIYWELEYLGSKDLHGNQAYDTDKDFQSKSNLKKHVKTFFKNYICESCGGHKLNGSGVIVNFSKISLYKEEQKKGFFGGEKWVDKHWKTIWRLGDVVIKPGGFFGGAGYIECKTCKHKVKAHNAFWGQFAANVAEGKRRGEW